MAVDTSRRANHPQQFCLKMSCNLLYYLGIGNFWHECRGHSRISKLLYMLWSITVNFYLFFGLINEYLSYLRSDLTVREKDDLLTFLAGHTSIYAKVLVLYSQRKRFKELFSTFWEGDQLFSSLKFEKESVKKSLKISFSLAGMMYVSLSLAAIETVVAYFTIGKPMRTIVVYYPNSHATVIAIIVRLLQEMHWWYITTLTSVIECVSICSLVFLEYKFKTVILYFQGLRKKYGRNTNSLRDQMEFEKDFVMGVKLHENTLRCTRSVQTALHNLYGIQIFQGIVCMGGCILEVIYGERSVNMWLAKGMLFFSLCILSGIYMLPGGEITYQAGLIPTSMFHSGWEFTRGSKKLRTIVVVAIIRSQVPVILTALGFINLSHNNFIMMLRSAYSFVTLMY